MRVQRRISWTIPVLIVVAAILITVTFRHDPWRSHTVLGWLGADVYYPRWIVYIGDWVMMALTTVADWFIAGGCVAIAFSFYENRNAVIRLNYESTILLSSTFVSIGAAHLVVTATMFSGIYLLDLLVRSAAASLTVVTAIFTVRALLWPPSDR
jgi:hypothetical protein